MRKSIAAALLFAIPAMLMLVGCGGSSTTTSTPTTSAPAPNTNISVRVVSRASDGLDLQALSGTLKMVKTGQELEDALNRPTSINNLDLDEDGKTDYVRVTETGQGNARLMSLTAVLGNGEEQEIATVSFEQSSPQMASVQVQGNNQIYGDNAYYHSHVSLTDLIVLNYLFAPRWSPYVSPWHYGYYPGYYRAYAPVPVTTYRTTTRAYVQNSPLRQTATSQTKTTIQSPNAGKSASSVRASLAKPTQSQKSFQERDPSKRVGSGGFGRPAPSPSASSSPSVSKPAPKPSPSVSKPSPSPKPAQKTSRPSKSSGSGFGSSRSSRRR